MRHSFRIAALVAIGSVALVAALAFQSTQPDFAQGRLKALTQPDTSSDRWRQLSDDVGLQLIADEHGVQRATLYVRSGLLWRPVALQGATELGPEVLPLGGR